MKKRLLIIWPVHREDWIEVFRPLAAKFELYFLAGLFPDSSIDNFVKDFAKTGYWSEFSSAIDLLDELAPDRLIFMSIETGSSMILNHLAKQRSIPTFILQHGIYTNYRDYRNREKLWKKKEISNYKSSEKDKKGFSSKEFGLKSLRGLSKIWLPFVLIYTWLSAEKGTYFASRTLPLSIKKPSIYLCFSHYNSMIHRETDRPNNESFRYIGSAELNGFLKEKPSLDIAPYYLHIDQAFADNSFGEVTVSKSEMIVFYNKLNEYCKSKRARLYIKLHPESYNSDWLPNDENIIYLRKVGDLNSYIQSAQGCFGFYSTMIIPAIYWKPTILFKLFYSGLQESLVKDVQVCCIDFNTFNPNDIKFDNGLSPKGREKIMEKYIQPKESISLESVLG